MVEMRIKTYLLAGLDNGLAILADQKHRQQAGSYSLLRGGAASKAAVNLLQVTGTPGTASNPSPSSLASCVAIHKDVVNAVSPSGTGAALPSASLPSPPGGRKNVLRHPHAARFYLNVLIRVSNKERAT
jgi:hypothetical protein